MLGRQIGSGMPHGLELELPSGVAIATQPVVSASSVPRPRMRSTCPPSAKAAGAAAKNGRGQTRSQADSGCRRHASTALGKILGLSCDACPAQFLTLRYVNQLVPIAWSTAVRALASLKVGRYRYSSQRRNGLPVCVEMMQMCVSVHWCPTNWVLVCVALGPSPGWPRIILSFAMSTSTICPQKLQLSCRGFFSWGIYTDQ